MNFRLLSKLLGIVAMLIGVTMIFSLPFGFPALGHRAARHHDYHEFAIEELQTESLGLIALSISIAVCFAVGGLLMWYGREAEGRLFRKEAMAVVGLSWVLATMLGALPFLLAGVGYMPAVRISNEEQTPQSEHERTPLLYNKTAINLQWKPKKELTPDQYTVVRALLIEEREREQEREDDPKEYDYIKRAHGVNLAELKKRVGPSIDPDEVLRNLANSDPQWQEYLLFPGNDPAARGREANYRIAWIRMGIVDSLFESQSGFSTTGATIIQKLEDPVLVPHCILFWRSSTHFLGGLGIIVLFVVILGQGSAGKALMRAEMPGPTKEGSTPLMQETAVRFALIYCALNAILAILLLFCGMSLFDALCHAFGTMATGGFSNYDSSLGAFNTTPAVDYFVTLFMLLAGTNFTLLLLVVLRQPGKLLADVEWRTYMGLVITVTVLVIFFGLVRNDFNNLPDAIRYSLFQVVSIITTTGYGTHDFDGWSNFGRAALLILMFVGGCAGSTGGGMKVIRHILFVKILRLEIEQAYHPRVVRPLRLGGKPVDDPGLRRNILVYFSLILIIFILSWLFVVTVEPNETWGIADKPPAKLIDSASAVAASLNNIGPGLGIVGASKNYAHFSPVNKTLFTWLMMIGRLEIFSILVLFVPGFWRDR